MESFDIVVLGLGAMGSSCLYQLSKRKLRLLGIDRFQPPHTMGSSHGESRMTRLAIGEGDAYTPLALRSHEIWRELEKRSDRKLLNLCGGLIIGSSYESRSTHGTADFLKQTIQVAEKYQIRHELLDAGQLAKRFPQFKFKETDLAYFERDAGCLNPELCIQTFLDQAERNSAHIHLGETVFQVYQKFGKTYIESDRGTYSTEKLIIAAGPWMKDFMPYQQQKKFTISQQEMAWYKPANAIKDYKPIRMPVFVRLPDETRQLLYGFPVLNGQSLKIASEFFDEQEGEGDRLHELSRDFIDLKAGPVRQEKCLYTITPDYRFIIDRHPEWENCMFISACSGHGFKHAPAIGEAVAALIRDRQPKLSLEEFRLH